MIGSLVVELTIAAVSPKLGLTAGMLYNPSSAWMKADVFNIMMINMHKNCK